MLRMEQLVDARVWKAAARLVGLYYKTYLSEESLSCTGPTVTTIYRPSLYRGILLYRVNNRKYYSNVWSLWPRHKKTYLCHMRRAMAQISLRISTVWSAPLLFAAWIVKYLYLL